MNDKVSHRDGAVGHWAGVARGDNGGSHGGVHSLVVHVRTRPARIELGPNKTV